MTIPFLEKRIIYPTKKDLQTLLLSSDMDHPPSLTEMEPHTLQQLNALETGSVAFIYEEGKKGMYKAQKYSPNLMHLIFYWSVVHMLCHF